MLTVFVGNNCADQFSAVRTLSSNDFYDFIKDKDLDSSNNEAEYALFLSELTHNTDVAKCVVSICKEFSIDFLLCGAGGFYVLL